MSRLILKQLITTKDIVHGVGKVTQPRGDQLLGLQKVDIPLGLPTLAEANMQNPAEYPRVRVGSIELQAQGGVYQQTLDVKPVVYAAGAKLTLANPYVYFAKCIYIRKGTLPYTLTNEVADGLNPVNPSLWEEYLTSTPPVIVETFVKIADIGTNFSVTAEQHNTHFIADSVVGLTMTVGRAVDATLAVKPGAVMYVTQVNMGVIQLVAEPGVKLIYDQLAALAQTAGAGTTLGLTSIDETTWLVLGRVSY